MASVTEQRDLHVSTKVALICLCHAWRKADCSAKTFQNFANHDARTVCSAKSARAAVCCIEPVQNRERVLFLATTPAQVSHLIILVPRAHGYLKSWPSSRPTACAMTRVDGLVIFGSSRPSRWSSQEPLSLLPPPAPFCSVLFCAATAFLSLHLHIPSFITFPLAILDL